MKKISKFDRTYQRSIHEAALEPVMASFDPGTYFLGDICYALDEEIYHKFWGDEKDFADGEYEVQDSKFAVGGTAHGDGTYTGSDGTKFDVDAGVLGVVPKELWKKDESDLSLGGGKVVNVERRLLFNSENGIFKFVVDGKTITVNTNDEVDEEEDEY